MSSLRDSHLRSRSTFVAGVVLTACALFACPPPPPSPGPAAARVVSFAAVPNVVPLSVGRGMPHEPWLKGNPPGLFEVPALRVPGAELTLRVLVIPDDEKSEHPAGFVEYASVPTDGGVLRIDFPAPPILLSPQEDESVSFLSFAHWNA